MNRRGWRWAAILPLGVCGQIAWTLLSPDQYWSMSAGLAFLIICCAAIVFGSTPDDNADRWRWHLIACGLLVWGLMFLVRAYQDNYMFGDQDYLSIFASIKHLCLLIAILPSSSRENSRAIQIIDLFQVGLVMLLVVASTWNYRISVSVSFNDDRVWLLYAFIAILTLISYLSQEDGRARRLMFNMFVLQSIYGIVGVASQYLARDYGLSSNSPAWVIGDISFLVYGFASLGLNANHPASRYHSVIESKKGYGRHLPPIFVTLAFLLLSFEVAANSLALGVALGAAGLLSYAARTTFLLDRYLTARDRLIAAERQHSRLLVDMIHEIRAPLGSMVLNASMLQRSAGLPDRQARWAEQIGVGGERVTAMLNDVLEIERIDAGLIGADLADCDVGAVIRAAVAVVAPQAAAAAITIEVGDGGDRPAAADRAMLERVLVNLLMNAVRFTPDGGTIAVVVDAADPIAVRVRDEGVGIPPAVLATLFDRFAHIGVPLRGARGSGLGLSICRGLMTAMGGRITIASDPGNGTVATVLIPRARGV